jgi:capsular exopolysaccharide synthesis family protein
MSRFLRALNQRRHDGQPADAVLSELVDQLPVGRDDAEVPIVRPTLAPSRGGAYRTVKLQPGPAVLPFIDSRRAAGEQYRIARTKILQHESRPQTILVSSAAPRDGKTITAINVAAALSLKSDGEVLLIDADIRRPAIPGQMGIPAAPGLADVLEGRCSLEEAIVRTEPLPDLCVLAAGGAKANPAELLDSEAWSISMKAMRQRFRHIVLDSPPVSAVADYDLLQIIADGILLVVRPDHTPRKLLFHALESVPREKLLGVLLNQVPRWFLSSSIGKDYYAKYYGAEYV